MMARPGRVSAAAGRRRKYARTGEVMSSTDVMAQSDRQWLYSDADLLRTPSIMAGMSVKQEREIRFKGALFIAQAGQSLRLPRSVITVATILFQRFLMRYSLAESAGKPSTHRVLHHYQVSAIALFVASKVEETVVRLKDFIIQVCRVAQKDPNLVVDEQDKVFWRWRDTILLNEHLFLEVVCFDLNIESPHQILTEMVKRYQVVPSTTDQQIAVRNASWAFLSDAGASQACLLFAPATIAAAALYLAASSADFAIEDDSLGKPWWTRERVRYDDMHRTCKYMIDQFGGKKCRGEPFQLYSIRPSDQSERDDKTRLRRFVTTPTPEPEQEPEPELDDDSSPDREPTTKVTKGGCERSSGSPARSVARSNGSCGSGRSHRQASQAHSRPSQSHTYGHGTTGSGQKRSYEAYSRDRSSSPSRSFRHTSAFSYSTSHANGNGHSGGHAGRSYGAPQSIQPRLAFADDHSFKKPRTAEKTEPESEGEIDEREGGEQVDDGRPSRPRPTDAAGSEEGECSEEGEVADD